MGHAPTLLSQLTAIETEISKIDGELAEVSTPHKLDVTLAELRKFVSEKALDLRSVHRADITTVR